MNAEEFYKLTGLPRVQSIQKNYPLFDYNDLMKFAEDFHTHQKNSEWKPYPEERPADYGKYEVYRAGCDKQHYETWNNTGWAYNNRDITHWRPIVKPPLDAPEKDHRIGCHHFYNGECLSEECYCELTQSNDNL